MKRSGNGPFPCCFITFDPLKDLLNSLLMVYVFEGARNSGKSFLSNLASQEFGVLRFQFDFAGAFRLLSLESKSREAHSFAMGKEMMLMQLANELFLFLPRFIHDRGILSVLAWGIYENRITRDQALEQIDYLESNGYLSGIEIIYIEGQNPDQNPRNKDQWDFADGSNEERAIFEWLVNETKLKRRVTKFVNRFNQESADEFLKFFSDIL